MTDEIWKLRYITHGLYEWGKGYVSNDVAEKWRKFFDEFVDYGWTVASVLPPLIHAVICIR